MIDPREALRRSIVQQIEEAGGRHDEPDIYGGPAGDPGIGGGPGSISWEINGDLASLVVGGTAAIIMEVLHPSVMAGVFTRPELVLEPGLAQIGAMLLLLTATIGVSFAIQAQFSANRGIDLMLRAILAAITMVVLLHPDQRVAAFSCIPVGMFVAYWVLRRRNVPVVAPARAG